MEIQDDFKELLELFNSNGVEYIVVGAHALAHHGAPRFTGDLDLWVCPTPANAARIMKVLNEFGFGSIGLNASDFEQADQVIQLGMPPVRIDLLTSLTGVAWKEAHSSRVPGRYGDVTVSYLGLEQFKANKKAIGRMKDLADLEALDEK